MRVPPARKRKVQTPYAPQTVEGAGLWRARDIRRKRLWLGRNTPLAAFMLVTRRGFPYHQANAVEEILEAERTNGARLSHRLVLAHLPRVLRADGRANRTFDKQPRPSDAGRLRLHEYAPQTSRRREAALHRRDLRVGRADV